MKTLNQKGLTTLSIVLIVAVIIIAGGLLWWSLSDNTELSDNNNGIQNENNTNLAVNTNSVVPTFNTNVDTSNWMEYKDEELNISFKYPSEYETKSSSNSQIVIAVPEHIIKETEIPSVVLKGLPLPETSVEEWLVDRGIEYPRHIVKSEIGDIVWYQYEYNQDSIFRVAYIEIAGHLLEATVSTWFNPELLDVFDGIVLSVRSIN